MTQHAVIPVLQDIVGKKHVLTREAETAPYTTGFREGSGAAIAVVLPATIWQQWQVLEQCVSADIIVIMQAANTGLTGGSTPNGNYDRPLVIINTTRIKTIHVLEQHNQIIALSGASLYALEEKLKPLGRMPHSVIGSSCIGASIVGGICNNSGGALVERGPAYTEMALYAQLDQYGKLELINHLDIELGNSPEEILTRLENRDFDQTAIQCNNKHASDNDYADWIRDTSSPKPARYNADPRRLHEASGCAGKLAVFAVRVDSFDQAADAHTFYLGSNQVSTLQAVRKQILDNAVQLPISAEYLHRDIFELSDQFGRETVVLIRYLGTKFMPQFFNIKQRLNALTKKIPLLPENAVEKAIQIMTKVLPTQVPKRIADMNSKYRHQLILTVKGEAKSATQELLDHLAKQSDLHYIICSDHEAKLAYLIRFAAAGAAIQYAKVHHQHAEGIVALDIALPRNTEEWFEHLPKALNNKLIQKYYYGHFLCHVFHQDYIVKKGENLAEVKAELLAELDKRGAEYPAEHNVGNLYKAKPELAENYKALDPSNSFNPGIGKMSKKKYYQ